MTRKRQHHEVGTIDFATTCANVARMDTPEQRCLALSLQRLSWIDPGFRATVDDLVRRYALRIGSETMRRLGAIPGTTYSKRDALWIKCELFNDPDYSLRDVIDGCFEVECSVSAFQQEAVALARRHLSGDLRRLTEDVTLAPPGYFWELPDCLSDWLNTRRQALARGVADTAQARQIRDAFEYAFASKGMVVVYGRSGSGKSTVATCEADLFPDRWRYVEVPETDDLRKLQRSIAHGLGLHDWAAFSSDGLTEEAMQALRQAGVGLVLDEAHRLWPAARRKPSRIELVHRFINQGIPLVLLGIGEDFRAGMMRAKEYGYAVPQFNKRREMAVDLQGAASREDICRVMATKLPELPEAAIAALGSDMSGCHKLDRTMFGAVAAVAKRARYLAAGIRPPTVEDVGAAIAARTAEFGLFDIGDSSEWRASKPPRSEPEPPAVSAADQARPPVRHQRPLNDTLERGGRGSASLVMGRIAAPAESLAEA